MCVRRLVAVLLASYPLSVMSAHCLVDAQPLSFGSYDIFQPAPLDAITYINLQCTDVAPFRLVIDGGMNGDGSFAFRRLQGPTSTSLLYNLYLDASRRQIWGDGSGSSLFYSGVPSGSFTQVPVYARIPPAQRVEPGGYSDSVVITVEW